MSAKCHPQVWRNDVSRFWYVTCKTCGPTTEIHTACGKVKEGSAIFSYSRSSALTMQEHYTWRAALKTAWQHVANDIERWGC